jgi:glucans biosynthesis protein
MMPRRLTAPSALAFLLVLACDSGRERGSTLPNGSGDANPEAGRTRSATPLPPPPEPATPEALFDYVAAHARALAQAPYHPPDTVLPGPFGQLGYDQYRGIRFRPEAALWRGESTFEIQLFHPGFAYRKPVRIHVVENERVRLVPFDPARFDYGRDSARLAGELDARPGHAGFRVHYPLNEPDSKDEVVVFLGASYFRLLGRGHVHGLSSRGLAVNVATDLGEEFPDFRAFWLVRPLPDASTMTFYALLDGPSVTGAYRFELDPGAPTALAVDARLFARRDVLKLGVAPLTSMYLFGQTGPEGFDDFRPQVHDSDGLLAFTGAGEWIWRPLSNHADLHVSSLRDSGPGGFGLAQRARDFEDYLDLEARYHRRPSEWVDVGEGDWGTGGVELVEIPTETEFNDNIVVSWVPEAPFRAGDQRRYQYRLVTFDDRLPVQTLAQVERTRIGWDALPGQGNAPSRSRRRFVIDFTGGDADVSRAGDVAGARAGAADGVTPGDTLSGDGSAASAAATALPVEAVLGTSSGTISDVRVLPLPGGAGWRATFRLDADPSEPADMHLHLVRGAERLTETWTYVWYGERER